MEEGVLAGSVEVGGDHFSAHFLDGDFRDPTEFGPGFGSVSEQRFDFCRAVVTGVHLDDDIADGDAGGDPAVNGGDGGDLLLGGAADFEGEAGGGRFLLEVPEDFEEVQGNGGAVEHRKAEAGRSNQTL